MAVRNAQHQKTSKRPSWASTSRSADPRSHRTELTRRAHRAAHAAAQREKRLWACVGSLTLIVSFSLAVAIVELVH